MMSKISMLLFIPRTLETKCRRVYKCDLSEFELWTSETSLTFLLERREKTVKVLQWKFRIKEFRISSGIVLKNYLRRSWISQSLSRVDTDNGHFLFLTATSVKKTQLQTLVRLFLTRVVKPAHRCAARWAHGENVTAQYLRFIFSSHDNVDSVCQQQHFVNKIREDKSEGKHGRGRRSDSTCVHIQNNGPRKFGDGSLSQSGSLWSTQNNSGAYVEVCVSFTDCQSSSSSSNQRNLHVRILSGATVQLLLATAIN